jgi:serine/threonine protein kinase/tetratricopeptide (TPR) repeat protein
MGEVYEAEDQELGDQVAVKTIRPEILAQPNAIARFRREVHLARKVTHPNVCRIFDLFRHKPDSGSEREETVFISMELLHGTTLAAQLEENGRMSEAEALPLVQQMASALAAAHTAGILHRDFKPGNIVLVTTSGSKDLRAVVTDFGLAVQSSGGDGLSTGHSLLGTPMYMSPEQIEGRAATVKSDVYAFGLVIYEMVTGQRPFHGDTPMSAAMKRLSEAPTSPRRLRPGLSLRWESAILRCLQRDPEERFTSAEDVGRALASDRTTIASLHAPSRRPNWRITSVLAGALLLIAVGLGYEILHRRAITSARKVHPRRSVAVLGFKNLSGKPEEGWLSTALSELLTSELAAGEQLRTVPGENVAQMKVSLGLQDADGYGKDTLARIQRAADADEVLVGSYLALGKETGGRVHLDLKVQDVTAGETTAVIVEEGTEDDLPGLISRAGSALLEKLGAHGLTSIQAGEVTASVSANPEANRWYAEGLDRLRNFDPLAARDRLQKAVTLDDTFALAHSALSQSWSQLGYDQKAKDESRRAFDLSAGLSREDRLVIESWYLSANKDWPKAIEVDRTLYTFFPDNLEYGLGLAAAQTRGGKAKDAIATIEQLRKFPSPVGEDPRIDLQESRSDLAVGEAKLSKEAAERAEQKAKSAGLLLLAAKARFIVGAALYDLGQPKEAMAAYQEALQTYQRLGDREQVGRVYFSSSEALEDLGDLHAALKAAEQGLTIFEEIGDVDGQAEALNEIGIIYRHQGDFRSR